MASRGGRLDHRDDVQGLRCLAILLVVIYHSGPWLSGGFIGVDVFLVVSGYVVGRGLLHEHLTRGRVSLRDFYVRRAKRILPALALTLFVVLPLSEIVGSIGGRQRTALTGLSASVFNANTFLILETDQGYFSPTAELNALLHTWSLSLEEQFYLILPIAITFLAPLRKRIPWLGRTTVFIFIAATTAGLIFVAYAVPPLLEATGLASSDRDARVAFYSLLGRAWEFGLGLCVASLELSRGGATAMQSRLARTIGFVGILGSSALLDDSRWFPTTFALVPALGTALLLWGRPSPGFDPLSALLGSRPVTWIGDRSYGWYLWHWPLIVFAGALWPGNRRPVLVAAAIALLVADVSYRVVENPLRKRSFSRRRAMPLGLACVAGPAIAFLWSQQLTSSFLTDDQRDAYEISFAPNSDSTGDCTPSTETTLLTYGCLWPAASEGPSAILIGDSNAAHFTVGFVAGMNGAGHDAFVAARAGCPAVDLEIVHNNRLREHCRQLIETTLAEIITMDPAPRVVFLASSADNYLFDDQFTLRSSTSAEEASTSVPKQALWLEGLISLIARLEVSGTRVIVIHPVPRFPDWDPRRCATLRWELSPTTCGATLQPTENQTYLAVVELEDRAAGIATLDPLPHLCRDEQLCATNLDGDWLWLNANHLTIEGSRLLTPMFAESVERQP